MLLNLHSVHHNLLRLSFDFHSSMCYDVSALALVK